MRALTVVFGIRPMAKCECFLFIRWTLFILSHFVCSKNKKQSHNSFCWMSSWKDTESLHFNIASVEQSCNVFQCCILRPKRTATKWFLWNHWGATNTNLLRKTDNWNTSTFFLPFHPFIVSFYFSFRPEGTCNFIIEHCFRLLYSELLR